MKRNWLLSQEQLNYATKKYSDLWRWKIEKYDLVGFWLFWVHLKKLILLKERYYAIPKQFPFSERDAMKTVVSKISLLWRKYNSLGFDAFFFGCLLQCIPNWLDALYSKAYHFQTLGNLKTLGLYSNNQHK